MSTSPPAERECAAPPCDAALVRMEKGADSLFISSGQAEPRCSRRGGAAQIPGRGRRRQEGGRGRLMEGGAGATAAGELAFGGREPRRSESTGGRLTPAGESEGLRRSCLGAGHCAGSSCASWVTSQCRGLGGVTGDAPYIGHLVNKNRPAVSRRLRSLYWLLRAHYSLYS